MNRSDYLFKIGYINISSLFVYASITICLNLDIGKQLAGQLYYQYYTVHVYFIDQTSIRTADFLK